MSVVGYYPSLSPTADNKCLLLSSRYLNSNRICNDPVYLLHDANYKGENSKWTSSFVLCSFCSIWIWSQFLSRSWYFITFVSFCLFFFIPRLLFTSVSLPHPVPVSICPPIIAFFSPSQVPSHEGARGHPKSDSGSGCQPHRLFDKHFDFLLRSFHQHSPGDRLQFPFESISRCLAINTPGAAVMSGSLCMRRICDDRSVYGRAIKCNNAHFDPRG